MTDMTAIGIDMTDTEPVTDWTGLTSGHQKPALVQRLYDEMISAWADYNFACDMEIYTHAQLDEIRQAAIDADKCYSDAYSLWQLSYGDCTCTPRHEPCRVCVARARLADDGEMPF